MSNDAINRITIGGTGLIALVVVGGLCVLKHVPAIEAELAMRAGERLAARDMGWAAIDMDGRDLVLSGVAPDNDARLAAVGAAAIDGVRRVDNRLRTIEEFVTGGLPEPGSETPARDAAAGAVPDLETPASAAGFRTHLTVSDGRLVIDGAAPDEGARRRVIRRAQEAFGVASVEARLELAGGAPEDWERVVNAGIDVAVRLVLGEVVIDPDTFAVTGLTGSDAAETDLRETIAADVPEHYSASIETGSRRELDAVLRTSPALARRLAERRDAAPRTTTDTIQAPDTTGAPAAALDRSSCASAFRERLANQRILFATASATLTDRSQKLIDDLAVVLKQCPSVRVTIEGHTDDQGLRENNLSLSQRRAEAVMLYLVGRGIGLSRMSARGYGEERPLAPNETAEDRARNRRIEFVFES